MPRKPLEREDMRVVADYLRAVGARWLHPPNEGKRHPGKAAAMRRDGLLQPGAPDIFIFEKYALEGSKSIDGFGIVIELKRIGGHKPSDEQYRWLYDLSERGMLTTVCYGSRSVIDFLLKHMRLNS